MAVDDPHRPRGSVRSHLRKLMAGAAAVGLAAATTRSAPAASAGGLDGGGASADSGDAATSDGGVEADVGPLEPCPPDTEMDSMGRCHGYAVVDPMPPPARGCGCHKDPGVASGPDRSQNE